MPTRDRDLEKILAVVIKQHTKIEKLNRDLAQLRAQVDSKRQRRKGVQNDP